MQAVTIGLDIAKSLFRVHGIDAQGNVVIRRQLEHRQTVPLQEASTLLIGIDACVRDIEVVIRSWKHQRGRSCYWRAP